MSGVLNLLLAGAASAIKDAYFNLTTLLLNTSSTNGAQNNTFLDSSTNNFTITRNGNTTQGTFTPFSQTGWSNYFNGTGSGPYLRFGSSSALTFGTGDFTIEFWVNFLSINDGTVNYIYDMRDGGSGSFLVGEPSNTWTYINGAGNSVTTGMTSSTFSANQWYHVAICRASGVINFYVNGTKVSSNPADTSNYATSYISIMSRSVSDGANNNTNAYTSNFRIVKGTAVYTSNFTPSTTPLTAISGTSLLTCQANRFVDNSGNALTVAVDSSLSPSVQAFSPFAPTAAYDTAVVGGSGYFDGTGDLLQVPSSSNLALGTGDFTMELWVYPTSWNSALNQSLFSGNSTNYAPGLTANQYYPGKLVLGFEGVFTIIEDAVLPTTNMWSHVACTRSGNTFKIFINGVQSGSTITYSADFSSPIRNVGSNNTSAGFFNGYISSARIIKGTALYTTTFTPPTAPFTAITNTQLLLNYTNAGIFDSASKNVLETVGNAQVSTTQAKWGTTSMSFDGTGDWLLIPNNQMLNLNADFTIEFWIYLNSTSGEQCIFHNHNSDNNGVFVSVNGGGAGKIRLGAGNGSSFYVLIDSSTAISASTWTYVACTRSGSTWTVYINGSSAGTATSSSNPTFSTSDLIQIGRFTSGAPNALNAYIDDLRITKYARTITASPAAAFLTL